jgi:integrase
LSKKLTDRFVAALEPGAKRQDHWDATLPSFGVRVAPSGKKTWVVAIRKPGMKSSSRIALGHYPQMSLAQAREAARALMADPGGTEPSITVGEAITEHVERDQKGRGRRAWKEVRRTLERELAPLAHRPLASITRRDIAVMLNRVVDRGSPSMARRLLSHAKRLFTWVIEVGYLTTSPAAGVRPPGEATKRQRVLSPDELGAVLRACEVLGWPAGLIIRLLALTGQRFSEVAGARWSELDLDKALWTIPAVRMKGGRQHEVPLSEPALEIITGLPRLSETWVFPAQRGIGPTKNIQHAKQRLDRLASVSDWTIHDLRRTAATGMARLGVAPHVIAEVLAHARTGGVTGTVYVQHQYLPEKRAALAMWAQDIHPTIAKI